ncbi:MAG: hypothetical protein UX26_C0009G0020 [Parcubacteria group bacterium GW2011_GWC1_45_9]|nr:MAG: hypothetical protein UW85_C0010G0024 [Parcubacteria group bacterium GW2011_GWA1_Parcubacteria_45_10]KKT88615.1 MAG: hypothetical protein UW89_C0006G0023 [Parcubacteria group bacterium GW2011_GWB1_45_10]KKU17055.1 MAG: hypothetical protein UX26_C0009G0020 [Parcubacteria group bacterium GW2011_GWC1_45_9]HCI05270.1 hypothetical protein [Patescibacteria group bacterium]
MKPTVNNEALEAKSLGKFLQDSREAAGLSRMKFSQLSGISEELIFEIESDNFKRVSSMPYLKGILKKYSRFAEIDYSELAKAVQGFKTSGNQDYLPQNRFASKTSFKLAEFNPGLLVLLALVFYLGYQFIALVLPPKIVLNEINDTSIFSNLSVSGRVSGKVKDFFINSEPTSLEKGSFSKDIFLNSEINIIEFKATNFFGQEAVVRKMVIKKSE